MVRLAFHLFVVGTVIFALCSYGFDCNRPIHLLQTVVYKTCDLVAFFVCLFFHLMLAYFEATVCGFWGGFNCFFSFIWCQLFACLIRAALFCLPPAFVVWYFFATGICGLFFLSLPQAFVYSLFLSGTGFSAVGIRVNLLSLPCQRLLEDISVPFSFFGIMLCACRSSAEWGCQTSPRCSV